MRSQLRSDRTIHVGGRNTPYGLARDEIWPLCHFLGHLGLDHVEFELAAPGSEFCDAIVHFAAGPRSYQIKTTGPLWPRADGTLANFGHARRELVLRRGTGVSNFGPRQADILGEEYTDPHRMISKRRLLRAGCVGLQDAFDKVRSKYFYRRPPTNVDLLVNVWGLGQYFVTQREFERIVRWRRPRAPLDIFPTIHVFGVEAGHYRVLGHGSI